MATDANELLAFKDFLVGELQNGSRESLDELVARFRTRRDEAARYRKHLQKSIDQAGRGEARELDYDSVKAEIRDELAEEGITD
jgi:hypothetical protein